MRIDYYEELTEKTLDELVSFADWMNKNFGNYPLIIGGWAVWSYAHRLGSKDIDAVFPDKRTMAVALKTFFQAHGWKKTTLNQFAKHVETNKGLEQITIDTLTKQDSFLDSKLGIKLPLKLAFENCREYKLKKGLIYVPEPELLICYKIAAHLGRTQKLITVSGATAARFESKIWKDAYDVISIIKTTELNKAKILHFLKLLDLYKYLDRFLDDLEGRREILAEFNTNIEEIRQILK